MFPWQQDLVAHFYCCVFTSKIRVFLRTASSFFLFCLLHLKQFVQFLKIILAPAHSGSYLTVIDALTDGRQHKSAMIHSQCFYATGSKLVGKESRWAAFCLISVWWAQRRGKPTKHIAVFYTTTMTLLQGVCFFFFFFLLSLMPMPQQRRAGIVATAHGFI